MDGVTGDAALSATLNYLRPGSTRNRLYVAPGGHLTTTEYAPTTVTITNGRPHVDDFGLDRSGFTLLRHTSAVGDFGDPAQLDGTYAAEAARTGRAGARRGRGRHPRLGDQARQPGTGRRAAARLRRARRHAPRPRPRPHDHRLAARRAVQARGHDLLWRAFSPPPQDWPLALLDYRSVDDAEGEPNLLLFVDQLPDPDDVPDIEDPDAMPAGVDLRASGRVTAGGSSPT